MKDRWHVYLSGWLEIAWALDEDLSWVKRSLAGECRWSTFPFARIVHAAWPLAVSSIPEGILRGKLLVCQADNPPSFYLGTEEFERIAGRVDLWIARSCEALSQFRVLGLPVAHVPYAVDPDVFRPLGNRVAMRQSLGISDRAFVIGNFHRDSEGADLRRPKKQKGPDIFLEIARQVHALVPETVVLLAGPRRHWLLNGLRAAGVPVVFAGNEPTAADDYRRNILPRPRLNELYQALDVCLISSRWEGGPYSVLEALAAGTVVASSPVGVARDVLPSECLYSSVERAVEILTSQAKTGHLDAFCREAARRASVTNGPEAVRSAYLSAYRGLPRGGVSPGQAFGSAARAFRWRFLGPKKISCGESGPWLRKIEKYPAAARPELIEYPFEASREELFRTAAFIRNFRLHA